MNEIQVTIRRDAGYTWDCESCKKRAAEYLVFVGDRDGNSIEVMRCPNCMPSPWIKGMQVEDLRTLEERPHA